MTAQAQAAATMQLPLKRTSMRILLLLLLSATTAFSGEIVKYLPGYDGELPFKLETGYISVGDSELFYYFIESQGEPQEDPLFLWLTGGRGCSSFNGLIYEIGPMEFDIDNYTGGLPTLKYYPFAWTKTASIIFLDAPVGSGFSYSRTQEGWHTSDSKSAEQSYEFLKKWLLEHPQYLALQLYIGGDSYSGITVPLVTKMVIEGNGPHAQPHMNLIGYLLGSPYTDWVIDENSKIEFAYRMTLISEELYEDLKMSCNESYVDVDLSNTECVADLEIYEECVKDLNPNNILEPKCDYASPDVHNYAELPQRALQENPAHFMLSPPRIPELWCRSFNYAMSYIWANSPEVQDALHVRKGSVINWARCNQSISYRNDVLSVVDVHRFLSKKGLHALVDSGDRDMVIPFAGTEKWIKSLNLTVESHWRPWFIDGQVAGYTIKYSDHSYRLTYATVKGAGHTAPAYCRRECYEMFDRWIHWYPL